MLALDRASQQRATHESTPSAVRSNGQRRPATTVRTPIAGNQALQRMLRRKRQKPPKEPPQSPDEIAIQLESMLAVDPMDASGQVRNELQALEPEERGEVLTRLQSRTSTADQERLSRVLAEPAPKSAEAPLPETALGMAGEAEEEEIAESGEEEGEAVAATEEPAEPEEAAPLTQEEARRAIERRKAEEAKAQGPRASVEEAKAASEQAEAERIRQERARQAVAEQPPETAVAKVKEEPAAAEVAAPLEEKAAPPPAGEEQTREKAKAENPAGEPAAGAVAESQSQTAAALGTMPAEARGEAGGLPQAPGRQAQTAAAQPGPAPAMPAAEAGGAEGSGAEAILEEETAEGPAAAEADKADERMAEVEPEERPEAEVPEPEPPAPAAVTGEAEREPTPEEKEAAEESDKEEQAAASGGGATPAEAAPEDEDQEPTAPAAQADLSGAERQAGLESLAEDGGGEPAGGGGGGSAVSEQPQPESPDVSGAEPAAAMSSVSALKVGAIGKAMSGVTASISGAVSQEHEVLAANPPQMQRPSGSPVTRDGPVSEQFAEEGAVAVEAVEEVPAGEAGALEEPEPLPEPGPDPTAAVDEPAVAGGEGGQMTEADVENLQSAVRDMPTADMALATDAGPAPTLVLEGDADPQQTRAQRAELDSTVAEQQTQGAEDVAAPMGENEIYPTVPDETLQGQVPAGGPGGAATVAAVDDETAAIVAEEQQGESVRASVQQASAEMAARQQEHLEQSAQKRSDSEQEIAGIVEANASQQTEERQGARQRVSELRGQWSQGQREAVDGAQTEADQVNERTEHDIASEQEHANTNAVQEVQQGTQDAEAARERGESDADREKQRAESESSGVFGWLASKAKAFFDRLKQAVSSIISRMRQAVKAIVDAAKRAAFAVIDLARNAVIGLIRLAGEALIRIGDTLLAAFPELRDRFRGMIRDAVAAAEDAVNRLADGLKAAVAAALDALGAALDFLLRVYERALLAALDAANAVVQGAIRAAQAVVTALAAFAALIKDVAANPGQWLANLGAAVIDGIRNHLWRAFKEAVKNWFNQKLTEVLGVGMMIFNILMRGGIPMAQVGQMAFEGLKSAIPMALVAILVEKLVAMIVPAAGAVMAIIEGLQAAWGTVSRIIQAISRFINFLKAVKTGNAGPQFAEVLAAAAIVLIDFVANWLIRRIRGPASRIGGKVKAIARRIMARLRRIGQRIARAGRRVMARVRRAVRRMMARVRRRRRRPTARQRQRNQERNRRRIDEALRATREAVQMMMTRGVGLLSLKARVAFLKLRYRWRSLSVVKESKTRYSVEGMINPRYKLVQAAPQLKLITARNFGLRYKDVEERALSEVDLSDPRERVSSALFETGVVSSLKQAGRTPTGISRPVAGPALTEVAPQLAGRPIQFISKFGATPARDIVVRAGQEVVLAGTTGAQRVRRTPEALIEEQVRTPAGRKLRALYVVEATLDINFALKEGTVSHKKAQLPQSLALVLQQLPPKSERTRDFKIIYTIFSHGEPPEDVKQFLNEMLSTRARGRPPIEAVWIVVPLT